MGCALRHMKQKKTFVAVEDPENAGSCYFRLQSVLENTQLKNLGEQERGEMAKSA